MHHHLPPRTAVARSPGTARKLKTTALKPFTYSAMHLVVAVSVAFVLTGDWRIAFGVGVIEPMVQTLAYVGHERLWERLGRRQGARRTSGAVRHR